MTPTERKVAGVVGAATFVLLLAYAVGVLSAGRLQVAVVGTLVLTGLYFGGKRLTLETFVDGDDERTTERGVEVKLTEDEALEKVEEWSKERYGKSKIKFNWTDAKTDVLRLNWGQGDRELIRYYYSGYGPSGKGVLVFINQTTGELSHKTVEWQEAKEDPFEYSDYVKQYRREKKQSTMQKVYGRRQPRPGGKNDPFKPEDEDDED